MRKVVRWYYTQTLIDASTNQYDLHRLHGGSIEPGRFGNALRIRAGRTGSGMGLAANFATEARVYGTFLPADHEFVPGSQREAESIMNYFWYTAYPHNLADALRGAAWTIETWAKCDRLGKRVVLMDAGQGTTTSFRLEVLRQGRATRLTLPDGETAVTNKFSDEKALGDREWHHLAWVKPKGKNSIHFFVDGRFSSAAEFAASLPASPDDRRPGIVATLFDDPEFKDPQTVQVISDLADLAALSDNTSSVRLRAWIKAPHSGMVRFSTDSKSGMHLDVDHQPLAYGWFGRARRYRRSPRWGEIEMKKGQWYPVLIEIPLKDQDFDDVEAEWRRIDFLQRVYWSWQGSEPSAISSSVWYYAQADRAEAENDRGGWEPEELVRFRYNLTLGSDRQGNHAFDGWLDEVRVSSVARYHGIFQPRTHSMMHGTNSPPLAQPTGPPLLFANQPTSDPIQLGSRKHLFIDDVLLADSSNIRLAVQRPRDPTSLEPELPNGDHSFFEMDGRIALFAPAGYEGREDYARLWLSDDGVHFFQHQAVDGLSGGSSEPTIIQTGVNAWGRMAIDPNPNTPAWARFKYTAGVPHRGIVLLVSPDAVHWRRNETTMLQVGTGGESHWYWDDQRGRYRYLLKWDHGPGGRQAVEVETDQIFASWPLSAEGDPEKDLATPLGYMPSRFVVSKQLGQVYRTRAAKYLWAPDTYLAFLWRFDPETQARQVELATSRDGTQWKHYGTDWYMPAEFDYTGNTIHEVTSVDGLIRRGDEIWQYADYSTGRHDSNAPHWRVRLTQRFDGFVAIETDESVGQFTTKPLVFDGSSLTLNIAVEKDGGVTVALLDERGQPIKGFTQDQCDPIRVDHLRYCVSWNGASNLSKLSGKTIRLQVRMKKARLFALRFE